jgi:hypothetical protein
MGEEGIGEVFAVACDEETGRSASRRPLSLTHDFVFRAMIGLKRNLVFSEKSKGIKVFFPKAVVQPRSVGE